MHIESVEMKRLTCSWCTKPTLGLMQNLRSCTWLNASLQDRVTQLAPLCVSQWFRGLHWISFSVWSSWFWLHSKFPNPPLRTVPQQLELNLLSSGWNSKCQTHTAWKRTHTGPCRGKSARWRYATRAIKGIRKDQRRLHPPTGGKNNVFSFAPPQLADITLGEKRKDTLTCTWSQRSPSGMQSLRQHWENRIKFNTFVKHVT